MTPNATQKQPYDRRMYLAQTLDPVHVGTGEFQLGRVDNTIVREAGTNLPKIPGSSLAGVVRAYTAMKTEGKYGCAGKGGGEGEEHCGQSDCPVCVTYGFSKGKLKHSFQGLAQFSDARILFFPVYTLFGPIWITSPLTLESAGVVTGKSTAEWNSILAGYKLKLFHATPASQKRINAGWLYLEIAPDVVNSPTHWIIDGHRNLSEVEYLRPALDRMAVIGDDLFSIVVEDQLEVRTSVSIDPSTGAAAKGALFTSEAIPRGTYLYLHVTVLDPQFFLVPGDKKKPAFDTDGLHGNALTGLRLMEYLGIGGAGTRGMGRTRIISTRAS
ncbi:MAG: type III-B CRISPR module RAMP protein Cmr4 [Acidobacteriota bacterium]|nr:type III-B CRISPR module RAMP protein Cmr4 [Acidobacteriota bacterium]